MKIFNWVHRKFHHKDGKKVEMVTVEAEKQVLLDHATLADVLIDGWRDGILTIGTFGFDPLSDFYKKNECPVVEKEEYYDEEEDYEVDNELDDDDDDENDMKECYDEEEELNPLVFTAFRSNYDENALKDDMRMALELGLNMKESGEEDEKRNKKRERTTLADLFSADSDMNAKRDRSKIKPESKKKIDDLHDDVHAKKKGLSFAKKLIPRVGEETRPIKKLHQRMLFGSVEFTMGSVSMLMRRMLKRKIHPDLEGKFQKMDSQLKPTICGLLAEEYGAKDSVSLLQTKDAMVF